METKSWPLHELHQQICITPFWLICRIDLQCTVCWVLCLIAREGGRRLNQTLTELRFTVFLATVEKVLPKR